MNLRLENIRHSFNDLRVLNDISFKWPDNIKRIGVLGPNGSGKTTLFKIISGEIRPCQGDIVFNHKNITKISMAERNKEGISKTFQIPAPILGMSVFQNVYIGTLEHEKNDEARILSTKKLLSSFNLISKADHLSDTLNVIELRFLEMARAFATKPKLILLDECMVGLDDDQKIFFIDLLKNIQKEYDCSIMMIEHNIKVMHNFCDYMLVLHLGDIVLEGTPTYCLESDLIQSIYAHRK